MRMSCSMPSWMRCWEQRRWGISGNISRIQIRHTREAFKEDVSSSIKLLEKVGELLEENHVFIENIDATIIAQAPKMRPHIDTMRENIAKALLIDVGQVNVKATTEEGLGFTGSGEGISSQAICLVTTPFDLTAQAMQGGCGSCSGCPKS